MRNILIQLRKECGLTQDEASRMIGISRAHYGRIENGERTPSLSIALKIKMIFKYQNDDIFLISNATNCRIKKGENKNVKN